MAELANITGLDETLKALRALPSAISGKNGGPLRKALYAAAKVIRDEVKAKAPVYAGPADKWHTPGLLRDSISIFRDRAPQNIGANEHYTIGVRKQRKKYAANARNLRLGKLGKSYSTYGAVFYAKFLEFGTSKMPRHPFFTPAFEGKKTAALDTFTAALAAQVSKAVEQAKKGGA
jgi:HK97 gp10 family phage protein